MLREERDTFDIDAQHRFEAGARHQIIWGIGYRASMDEIGSSDQIMLAPEERTIQLGSFLVQDEIILVPEQLRLTLGSKFEHNSFTGFEVQPSGLL
jgi:iron complex outermembrane receptor protein